MIQTEGVSTSPTLEKRRETQEDRGQVSDCIGRTPLLWGQEAQIQNFYMPRESSWETRSLSSCHAEATATRLEPGWLPGEASNSPGQLLSPGKPPGQVVLSADPFLTCKAQRKASQSPGPHKSSRGAGRSSFSKHFSLWCLCHNPVPFPEFSKAEPRFIKSK